jgi:hypothetical protein
MRGKINTKSRYGKTAASNTKYPKSVPNTVLQPTKSLCEICGRIAPARLRFYLKIFYLISTLGFRLPTGDTCNLSPFWLNSRLCPEHLGCNIDTQKRQLYLDSRVHCRGRLACGRQRNHHRHGKGVHQLSGSGSRRAEEFARMAGFSTSRGCVVWAAVTVPVATMLRPMISFLALSKTTQNCSAV